MNDNKPEYLSVVPAAVLGDSSILREGGFPANCPRGQLVRGRCGHFVDIKSSDTLSTFKSRLKTYFYRISFIILNVISLY